MEKLKIVLILVFLPFLIKSQEIITKNVRINKSQENTVYISGRIIFRSNQSNENIQKNEKCEVQKVYFFLNGLQISEKQFLELDLSNNMIFPSTKLTLYDKLMELLGSNTLRGYGYGVCDINYSKKSTGECIKEIRLSVFTYIPINLNGKIIERKEQENVFSTIQMNNIISVKRRFVLFGTGKIEIITAN